MSNRLHADLRWLPPAPADFSARLRTLTASPDGHGAALQALAQHALDENQLHKLSKAIGKLQTDGRSMAPLQPFRLGLISNSTTHFVASALVATAARHGLALECVEAGFDQVMQAALSPESPIHRERCDAVLLALDHRAYPFGAPRPGRAEDADIALESARRHLDALRAGLRQHGHGPVILQTLARPPESLSGSVERTLAGSSRELIDQLNRHIAQVARDSEDLLLDVADTAETVGLAEWHDPTLWHMAKLPFSPSLVPLYADQVARLLGALKGKSRKCLILDLDNTLWGGVIGDDGLDGILIGQGDATGEAHLSVQRTALALRERGVVLAVSSKNTDAVARLPFQQHPEMLLREEHIAVFQANWNDKATNIQAIARELSLGLDAMVFLDDNPMERDLVRRMLPQVAVPELPDDPALFARTLLAAGYFESLGLSAEDEQRAAFYQDNARRATLQQQAGDLDSYLRSLNMRMTVQPFDDTGRARIAQLINKSNQFNLTTRRYTEADVSAVQADPESLGLQVRLADQFGDNGMISVVICRTQGDRWHIDTWLMSCRVLGRQVEQAVLEELVMQARTRGLQALVGRYLPTEKNAMVRDHYARLGFELLQSHADGSSDWQLNLSGWAPAAVWPIELIRVNLPEPGLAQAA